MPYLFLKRNGAYGAIQASTTRTAYAPPFNFLPLFILLLLLAVAGRIVFGGYEDEAIKIEDIEELLDPEQLEQYRKEQTKVDDKFKECIQYILFALEDGIYPCTSCPPGIPFVTLKRNDIWYIGHTCQDDDKRHSKSFRKKHRVWLFRNFTGSKEECLVVELKLIRGYKYLPESQKYEIKLILPPYNSTDKF